MAEASRNTLSVSGSGHEVVQIIGDGNEVTLQGAKGLRLRSYEQAAFAEAPVISDRRGEPGYTATGRRETRLLSPYNTTSLPLQGRAVPLERLRQWLAAPSPLSVHVVIGGGGRGKTRLATELTAFARGEGWMAGFALRDELDVFLGDGCRTAWGKPALVVVDYAAAKAGAIARWLRGLAHDAGAIPAERPLRLLLLERAGGEGTAWWREVFDGAGLEAEAVREHLARDAPLTLGPLATVEERHAVFAATFAQARDTPAPPRSVALDEALVRASLGGEPLFLAMFGLVAARQGLAAAQALSADRIALDLAGQELERIGKVWTAHDLALAKDRPLHAHFAAVAALCEGMDERAAHAAIARESEALHQSIPSVATEAARSALHAALPGEAGGIAAIQPDILAEAAMILAFRSLADVGVATIRRAASEPGRRDAVRRSVIRACQDFLIRGERQPLLWLDALRADIGDLEALLSLADAMPEATVELRETKLALTEVIAEIARALPSGAERDGLLAIALNNLSNHLSALGRREEALRAVEEAVAIRRALAAARPDAFLPDLARALNNLSNCLSNLGRREEALGASEEAVANYRALAAARPDAFLPDLASALNNLSNRLSNLGRREEALGAVEEAVVIRSKLAAARPDAFLPDLATSCGARGQILRGTDAAAAAGSLAEGIAALRAPFLALPVAFASLMGALCRDYIETCETARAPPDMALLSPIIAAFQQLQGPEDQDGR